MRPLLVVMEEAHRYLLTASRAIEAADIVQKIAKEGRKYGIGAMVVSQRPSEVDETILSQCGTVFALRLQNADDRIRAGHSAGRINWLDGYFASSSHRRSNYNGRGR